MRKSVLALSILLTSSAAWADTEYKIDLTQPEHQRGDVSITFPETNEQFLDIKMPAWRTGYYRILNFQHT